MDGLFLALLAVVALQMLKARQQRQRIALLGEHLRHYPIERLMETLVEGYLRALGESDAERQAQVWGMLQGSEQVLCEQFQRFVTGFAAVGEAEARVSRLPFALPYATQLFPAATFDMRQLLAVHAQGIRAGVQNERGLSRRDQAYTLCAELLLMQHSCHWFCQSRAVASTRLLARHRTSYEQVLDAVAPETRAAYRAIVGR